MNSDLQTSGDLLVRNSNVVIANCRIRPGVARNGVFCQTGTLAVVGSDIVGSSFGGTCPFSLPAGNAVTIADGLGAAGYVGGGNTLRGGTSFNPCAPDGLPIDAGAFAFVDTVYSRYAHPNRPAEEMCTITPQAAEAGTTTRVDYLAPSNQSVIVAASFSLSPTPVRLPGDYPDLYLDAGSMFPIAALTPSGRRGSFGVAIPANVPPGTIAWLQAASVSANGDLRTSPCVPLVVD